MGNGTEERKTPFSTDPKGRCAFTQQELYACRPVITPRILTILFALIGIIFIPIGAIALNAALSVEELTARYDNEPECTNTEENAPHGDKELALFSRQGFGFNCTITITVEEDMNQPIYFYYQLHNFYQNHRRYVMSRSDTQLRGDDPDNAGTFLGLGSGSGTSNCDPQEWQDREKSDQAEGGDSPGFSLDCEDGEDDCEDLLINPCGLVAWSFFNDTYRLAVQRDGNDSDNLEPLEVDETGIAWESDRKQKFGGFTSKNFNNIPRLRGGGAIGSSTAAGGFGGGGGSEGKTEVDDDEHFIVWMRTATLPNFRKLWGVINTNLNQGDVVHIDINNRYNTYRFEGKKKVVLSTTSFLGGKNYFLGASYLSVGFFCLFLAVVFGFLSQDKTHATGDLNRCSWMKKAAKDTSTPQR
mmetsp:Transcript_13147/g.22250  ORF Transcript_13147/g.22250 Transcript_13147/m.22250 type:complete len:413 (-) Transcript_13147:287-1525(-)|eukprot:CAMPEP_0198212272 /NCGR_PEP_ID=MMETSP1445-20131203/25622_1 /TAXON_ID=36898 /ORGANISM="Pyramimonas sp., Strain CCMP2087" /LENGTH=412 /DNA_ID=CAMNT_0043886681 /DNA_START=292 /DNA_END=1530 /DNA_ORIENTATION=-